jgi:putative nucleotidyltransferase with HDIG domain
LDQTAPSGKGRTELPTALRDALRARLAGELPLPLLPNTAARVIAACRDERTGMDDLADLIERDPSLAAHILRVANSAGFAPRVPILSLQQAIGRVGLGTVGDVVLAVAMRERVFSVSGHQERLRELWRHSVATACYAKEVATFLRGDIESAFLCGLLHDVGMAITLQVVCDLERDGTVAAVSATAMEAAMLEFHCEFGARMARAWQLGPWIDAVIRHHHDPASARFRPDEIAVIALADALAYWALEPGTKDEDFVAEARFATLPLHEGGLRTLLRKRERVLKMVEALA